MRISSKSSLPPAVAPNLREVLIEMLGLDDDEILLDLIDTFLEDASAQVNRLAPQWRANNKREVMIMAHSLKSTSATFCAARLSHLCELLETELRDDQGQLDIPECIEQIQREHARVHRALEQERQKFLGPSV